MPATAAPKAPRSSTAITSAPAFLRAADTAATCSVAPVTATVEPTVSPLRRRCHPMVANEGSDTGSPPESAPTRAGRLPPGTSINAKLPLALSRRHMRAVGTGASVPDGQAVDVDRLAAYGAQHDCAGAGD